MNWEQSESRKVKRADKLDKRTWREKRSDTPANRAIARARDWINAKEGRQINVGWCWNQANRFDRSGIFIAIDADGTEIARKVFQKGNMYIPNPDFAKTNTGSYRQKALSALLDELEDFDDIGAYFNKVSV